MVLVERMTSPTEIVRELVGELETVLSAEYPPEQRHGLAIEAIFQPHIHFFTATLDGAPVGCGGVALLDGFAEVKRMYVRPGARGRGVAQAIIARLAAVAGEHGYSVLRLETGTVQHAALRFYRREGFARCGAFGDYARMPETAIMTSLFMEKAISSTNARSCRTLSGSDEGATG